MIDKAQIDKIESLAREAIRTAVGEVAGTTSSGRALEALKEFRDVLSPMVMLELIAEWRVLDLIAECVRKTKGNGP